MIPIDLLTQGMFYALFGETPVLSGIIYRQLIYRSCLAAVCVKDRLSWFSCRSWQNIQSLLMVKDVVVPFSPRMSLTCSCCCPKPFGMCAAVYQTRVCVDPTRSHNALPSPLSPANRFCGTHCCVSSSIALRRCVSLLNLNTYEPWPCVW